MTLFLATAPWLLMVVALPILLRQRPRLAATPARLPPDPPLVSVIVPTLDDARRVGPCLASLLDTDYPSYEIIVADVDSTDGTREIVAALETRAPDRVRLLDAGVTPVGWEWPAWACWRGYEVARGDLVLFTHAGTLHESTLLVRAVAALERERADLVSVFPRLTMQGFWERLIMPHIWLILTARLPTAPAVNRWQDPADAVASRYFVLFRRDAYEAVGGHEAVAGSYPDATDLARATLERGQRVFLAHGEAQLETRMYRSLYAIADDLASTTPRTWRVSVPGWAARLAAWTIPATPLLFFVAPPVILGGSLLGVMSGAATPWAFWASVLSLVFWLVVYARHRIRPAYAVAYPAGALISSLIFARSIIGWGRT